MRNENTHKPKATTPDLFLSNPTFAIDQQGPIPVEVKNFSVNYKNYCNR